MKIIRKVGATSQILQVFIQDSSSTTGAGLTGLVFNSGSLTAYFHRDTDTTATAISLVTMTVGAFTSSGFKEIDATNMPGFYQLCPPNTALGSGASSVVIMLKGAANMAPLPIEIDLDAQVDVTLWNGTAVSSPATAGIPDVNVKNVNNVSASSVTTVSANQGTTQPLNFTGTAGSALVKSDMVDIAGAAVSTSTAQIGVNTVNLGGTAQTGRDIGASVLLSSGTGTGQISLSSGLVALSGTQTFNVTGNVTGNLSGSVGSVTGNVGGNVVGSVASVTARVTANTDQWNGTTVSAVPPDTIFMRNGTAQAGSGTTITLDAGASATDNLYTGAVIFIRSGTGAGQTNLITGYVGATKVATVSATWATNPSSSSVFSVMAFGPGSASVSGTVNANVTQINGQTASAAGTVTFPGTVASATNITAGTITTVTNLTNAPTAGDFTLTMKTSLNAATPASVVGAVGSVTARVTANTDQLAGQTVTAAAGVTFPTSVASPTNITAGTITTATNLTNAPTVGDFTATMKTSLNAATPASVVGAVGSVTAAVTINGASPLTESYAAVGAGLTLAQGVYAIVQQMGQMSIASTTMTVKKRDGSTTAKTYTLDSATVPTSIVEAT